MLLHQERRDVSPSKDEPCPSSIEHARNLPTNTKPHSTNFLAASNITVGSNVFLNIGNLSEGDDSISVNFLNTSDDLLDSQIQCLRRLDEVPKCSDNVTSMSREDRYALQQMQRTKNVIRGHYQVGLPGAPCLPDNCSQARAQLSRLRGRLVKDPALKEKYSKVDVSLRNSFGGSLSESVFWTEFMSVLYMIRNSVKRFPVFVSNRLAQIEDRSTSSQWRFVPSSDNPADDGTRPSCSVNRWLTGPSFLQEPESRWPQPPHSLPDLPAEFEIVKQTVAGTEVAVSDGDMEESFARFSSFYRLKRTVAWILRLKGRLLRRPVPTGPLTVDEMHQAEMTVIAAVQREAFPKDYRRLETQNSPCKIVKLSLQKLNPIHVAGGQAPNHHARQLAGNTSVD